MDSCVFLHPLPTNEGLGKKLNCVRTTQEVALIMKKFR